MEQTSSPLVLVTGCTGFVASHIVLILLENDYRVRGSVRSLKDEKKYQHFKEILPSKSHLLEFVQADLLDAGSWNVATKGADFVMHVASPLPSKPPRDENELIKPAKEGTLNVLQASLKNGVKKVVVTSSSTTISVGHNELTNEDDWSVLAECASYEKSKYIAEKAVWEFWNENKDKIEITVINPGMVFGPPLSKNAFTSGEVVEKFMKNKIPGIPKIQFPLVDVRDLALGHLRALQYPKSNGRRYLIVSESLWLEEIAKALKDEFDKQGYSIQTRKVGKCPLTVAAWFDPLVKLALPSVGKPQRCDNSRSVNELQMKYRPMASSVVDMAYKLIELGIVPKKTPKNSKCH